MAANQHQHGIVPPTQDFLTFTQNNPQLAQKATVYDQMARSVLKHKYNAFGQGTLSVITHRTAQDPVAQYTAGPRDPVNAARHWCPACNVYKPNIKAHLETHNKHPGKSVYCPEPSCLMRMPRDDSCTLPEHVLGSHPEIIFGPNPHPLQNFGRIIQLCTTTDKNVLDRVSGPILQMFVMKAQDDIITLLHQHNLPFPLQGGQLRVENIQRLSRDQTLIYLQLLRSIINML